MAGSQELYLGKRMASRILPPTSARELLGEAWPSTAPEEGSREELDLAHALTDRLAGLFAPGHPGRCMPARSTRPSDRGGSRA